MDAVIIYITSFIEKNMANTSAPNDLVLWKFVLKSHKVQDVSFDVCENCTKENASPLQSEKFNKIRYDLHQD